MNAKKGKLCPLCFTNSDLTDFYCLEKDCAWWNHIDEECSIVTLATLASIDIGGRGHEDG